jgi:hypothetical protein
MKNRVLWTVISVFVVAMVVGASSEQPLTVQTAVAVAPAAPGGGWTHSGCWTQFSSGTCYDIYTDASGNHYKCKPCGETKKPNQNTCTAISQATLNSGRWCS